MEIIIQNQGLQHIVEKSLMYLDMKSRVMFSNKKSSFMAGILIQAPFITKKWMYIIKNGQRPRGLEQEGLKGQKFLAG